MRPEPPANKLCRPTKGKEVVHLFSHCIWNGPTSVLLWNNHCCPDFRLVLTVGAESETTPVDNQLPWWPATCGAGVEHSRSSYPMQLVQQTPLSHCNRNCFVPFSIYFLCNCPSFPVCLFLSSSTLHRLLHLLNFLRLSYFRVEAELRSHSAWSTDDESPPTTNRRSQSGIQTN